MNCCGLNCEVKGLSVEAIMYYEDEYGSKIPLCAECYAELREESFAPGAEISDE